MSLRVEGFELRFFSLTVRISRLRAGGFELRFEGAGGLGISEYFEKFGFIAPEAPSTQVALTLEGTCSFHSSSFLSVTIFIAFLWSKLTCGVQ